MSFDFISTSFWCLRVQSGFDIVARKAHFRHLVHHTYDATFADVLQPRVNIPVERAASCLFYTRLKAGDWGQDWTEKCTSEQYDLVATCPSHLHDQEPR